MNYPKITIVTPCLDVEDYIESTVRSVLDQEYPNIEYILIDGGSRDRTLERIEPYRSKFAEIVSEPDDGIYAAINKGFSLSSGEIMGWLNAGDLLQTKSLFTIAESFECFPEVNWITGIPCNVDEIGRFHESRLKQYWTLNDLLSQKYGTPQQESTFWRRSLWDKAGGAFNCALTLAADFELWCRFFEHSRLISIRAYLAGFRKHDRSISFQQKEQYQQEVEVTIRSMKKRIHKDSRKEFRVIRKQKHEMIVFNFEEQTFRLREAF